jgi:hypothetical protein
MAVSNPGQPTDISPLLEVAAEFRKLNEAAEARGAKMDRRFFLLQVLVVLLGLTSILIAVLR